MSARRIALLAAVSAAFLAAPLARAGGGSYVFDGGTAGQQAQARAALEASAFDWSTIPATITIHIAPGTDSWSRQGEIWLDGNLLDSGRFGWGTVQHEYAHQIDFYLLNDFERSSLTRALGGLDWCGQVADLQHFQHGCERFASTVAWSYWQSKDNSLKPRSRFDEAGGIAPTRFRPLLERWLVNAARPIGALSG